MPGLYAGNYGWDHAAYWGIAEAKAGVDLKEWYKTRTEAGWRWKLWVGMEVSMRDPQGMEGLYFSEEFHLHG